MIKIDRAALTALELDALTTEFERVRETRPEIKGLTLDEFIDLEAATTLGNYVATHTTQKLTALSSLGLRFLQCSPEKQAEILTLLDSQ
jgi:hypothetical protein